MQAKLTICKACVQTFTLSSPLECLKCWYICKRRFPFALSIYFLLPKINQTALQFLTPDTKKIYHAVKLKYFSFAKQIQVYSYVLRIFVIL